MTMLETLFNCYIRNFYRVGGVIIEISIVEDGLLWLTNWLHTFIFFKFNTYSVRRTTSHLANNFENWNVKRLIDVIVHENVRQLQ